MAKARPVFRGHYQPHLPADLGYYDLRLPEARAAQADLAREYGIHGFCYYHYWFNGRRVLERPFNEILSSGEPDFPFCLCWANENWTRRWDGRDNEVLLKQVYSAEDDVQHIRSLTPAFSDRRYIQVDGKPIFLVYRSTAIPDCMATTDRWRREIDRAGFPGIYLVRVESFGERGDPRESGFDAGLEFQPFGVALAPASVSRFQWWQRKHLRTLPQVFRKHSFFSYELLVKHALEIPEATYPWIRCVCPSWDNTARRREGGLIIHGSSPSLFKNWVRELIKKMHKPKSNHSAESFLFINAWNEWAEGNHLELCQRWGRGYLKALKSALDADLVEELSARD